ncbi:MAG TPA: hypothetical protein VGB42_06625 [Candidatus Thermoplasmatota archaeon]
MGYDMRTVREDKWFSANWTLMGLLRAAIVESGVNLNCHPIRWADPEMESDEVEGDLMLCFSSNNGWLVTAEEAAEIASKVEAALPRWIAAPEVRGPRSLAVIDLGPPGGPAEWVAAEEVTLDNLHREPKAAEIGASERAIQPVREFIAFCRDASELGGFHVY